MPVDRWPALAAIRTGEDQAHVFATGQDRLIHWQPWRDSTGPDTQVTLIGSWAVSPPSVAHWNAIDVFFLGGDQGLYRRRWDSQTGWWPSDTGFDGLGGVWTTPPTAVALTPDLIHVFGLGTNRHLYWVWWDG